jgi:hypothetical protein
MGQPYRKSQVANLAIVVFSCVLGMLIIGAITGLFARHVRGTRWNRWSDPASSRPTYFQTCKHCYSVRFNRAGNWEITHESPRFSICSHAWDDGQPSGVEDPIYDGHIILVFCEGTFGAFVPIAQSSNSMKYDWYFRTDGQATFDPADPAVQVGSGEINVAEGTTGGHVSFGPFSMFWSECEAGRGWLYYDALAGGRIEPSDVRICLTGETDVSRINGVESEWIYRAFPGDAGLPASALVRSNDADCGL